MMSNVKQSSISFGGRNGNPTKWDSHLPMLLNLSLYSVPSPCKSINLPVNPIKRKQECVQSTRMPHSHYPFTCSMDREIG